MGKKRNLKATFSRVGLVLALTTAMFMGLIGLASAQVVTQATTTVGTTTCAINGASSDTGAISFGTLVSGQSIAPEGTGSQSVTIDNDSTAVSTELGTVGITTGMVIQGTDWYTGDTPVSNPNFPVGSTEVQLSGYDAGATNGYLSPFALTSSPSGLIMDFGPTPSGFGTLSFGVTVPSTATPAFYTQTITVSAAC